MITWRETRADSRFIARTYALSVRRRQTKSSPTLAVFHLQDDDIRLWLWVNARLSNARSGRVRMRTWRPSNRTLVSETPSVRLLGASRPRLHEIRAIDILVIPLGTGGISL